MADKDLSAVDGFERGDVVLSDVTLDGTPNEIVGIPGDGVVQLRDLELGAFGGTGNLDAQSITLPSGDLQTTLDEKATSIFVNVKDWGAVGDGATDDTHAIVTAALSLRLTGGTLFFPKGTYRVGYADVADLPWGNDAYGSPQASTRPSFQVFSNMIIQGESQDATIIKPIDGTNTTIIHANTSRNIVFKDFTLDGNKASLTPPYFGEAEGINIKDDCRDIHFSRVTIRNTPNEGLDIDNTNYDLDGYRVFISECTFEDCAGNGIHNAQWCVIDKTIFRRCGRDRYSQYINGYPSGSVGQAAIDTGGESLVIRDCAFLDNVRAVSCYYSTANKWGLASGTLTFTGLPSVGETITIAGQAYTWSTAGKTATCNIGTDVFTSTAHGWTDGTAVQFVYLDGGNGLSRHVTYYVRDSAANTFKLAATVGGVAIDVTSAVTGARLTNDWPVTGEVEIGPTAAQTVINLSEAIQGLSSVNTRNTAVESVYDAPSQFATGAPSILRVTATARGTAGNAVTLSEASTNVAASGATLSGGGTLTESQTLIDGCRIEGCMPQLVALELGGIRQATVRNCIMRGRGVMISFSGSNAKIIGNDITVEDNHYTAYALSLAGPCCVTGNTIIGGGMTINASGSGSTFTGNNVSSAYGGLVISGTTAVNMVVTGNTFATTGNTVNGVAGTATPLECLNVGQTGHIITGNRVSGGNNNIRLQASSVCTGNILTGGGNGISVTGTANSITGNFSEQAITNTGVTNVIVGNYRSGQPMDMQGSGTPEGVVSAPVGSTFRRTDGGAATSFYIKESGTGNTGWVAK